VEHLYCPGQDGIVVGAAGITIDLKGFTLRGDRTGGNHGISDEGGYGRVTIRNGVIRNFYEGINANAGGDDISVVNVIFSGNLFDGLFVAGDSATKALRLRVLDPNRHHSRSTRRSVRTAHTRPPRLARTSAAGPDPSPRTRAGS
jgi:hypothetical protein